MGFDCELIVVGGDIAKEHLMCSVCMDLVENGVTLRECAHNFCQECIDGVKRTRNLLCPDCRTPFGENDICPPTRLMRNILSGIRLRCQFATCQENVGYDNYT